MKKILILFFTVFSVNGIAQTVLQKAIIDSVLNRTAKVLALSKSSPRIEYLTNIRIIDLTQSYSFDSYVFNGIHCRITHKMPFDLNNGIFRDIIFAEQKQNNQQIELNVFLCEFEPNYFIQRTYNYNFVLTVNNGRITKIKQHILVSE